MKIRISLLVGAAILSVTPACSRQAGPSDASGVKDTVNGVSYEVRGRGGNSLAQNVEGYRELIAGSNTLRVKDGHITANGKDAGEVKQGDSVLLDVDGAVTVNGQKR
jgi:hypothetical protein